MFLQMSVDMSLHKGRGHTEASNATALQGKQHGANTQGKRQGRMARGQHDSDGDPQQFMANRHSDGPSHRTAMTRVARCSGCYIGTITAPPTANSLPMAVLASPRRSRSEAAVRTVIQDVLVIIAHYPS